jgi:hypothetical protein
VIGKAKKKRRKFAQKNTIWNHVVLRRKTLWVKKQQQTQNQTLRTLKKPESTEQGKDLKNAIIRLEFLSFVPLRVLGG